MRWQSWATSHCSYNTIVKCVETIWIQNTVTGHLNLPSALHGSWTVLKASSVCPCPALSRHVCSGYALLNFLFVGFNIWLNANGRAHEFRIGNLTAAVTSARHVCLIWLQDTDTCRSGACVVDLTSWQDPWQRPVVNIIHLQTIRNVRMKLKWTIREREVDNTGWFMT
jgi:hypothetical protein